MRVSARNPNFRPMPEEVRANIFRELNKRSKVGYGTRGSRALSPRALKTVIEGNYKSPYESSYLSQLSSKKEAQAKAMENLQMRKSAMESRRSGWMAGREAAMGRAKDEYERIRGEMETRKNAVLAQIAQRQKSKEWWQGVVEKTPWMNQPKNKKGGMSQGQIFGGAASAAGMAGLGVPGFGAAFSIIKGISDMENRQKRRKQYGKRRRDIAYAKGNPESYLGWENLGVSELGWGPEGRLVGMKGDEQGGSAYDLFGGEYKYGYERDGNLTWETVKEGDESKADYLGNFDYFDYPEPDPDRFDYPEPDPDYWEEEYPGREERPSW